LFETLLPGPLLEFKLVELCCCEIYFCLAAILLLSLLNWANCPPCWPCWFPIEPECYPRCAPTPL